MLQNTFKITIKIILMKKMFKIRFGTTLVIYKLILCHFTSVYSTFNYLKA